MSLQDSGATNHKKRIAHTPHHAARPMRRCTPHCTAIHATCYTPHYTPRHTPHPLKLYALLVSRKRSLSEKQTLSQDYLCSDETPSGMAVGASGHIAPVAASEPSTSQEVSQISVRVQPSLSFPAPQVSLDFLQSSKRMILSIYVLLYYIYINNVFCQNLKFGNAKHVQGWTRPFEISRVQTERCFHSQWFGITRKATSDAFVLQQAF